MRQTWLWGLLGLGVMIQITNLLRVDSQPAPLFHRAQARGPALLQQFAYPVALVLQPGQMWVVDHNNNRVLALTLRPPTVKAVGGNGQPEASGDGGPAIQAGMFPLGLARDAQGNLYVGDHYNHRVRQISPDGRMSTIAGTGRAGFSGDGGPAALAQLHDPTGVAVDAQGTIYIADQENQRIRQIKNGLITSLNLGRLNKPWSLGFDCRGRLLIVDLGQDQILRWDGQNLVTLAGVGTTGAKGDGGPATAAQLSSPVGVAVRCRDQEELFIADSGNDRVRWVDGQGIIRTFAGTGEFGFGGDGGPAVQAKLGSPYGVAVAENGDVFIADANNNRIRRVDRAGQIQTVLSPEGMQFDP
ncbi:hypothetical protein [Candidatus Cyanaurora vandensis]|uniref:NHL domain-containing protein n=1 Tax=Candidatus Cyanaurora vandensis TaxID=2714958 RepID=UPI00257B78D2|nr:hypothetical protein [Candidatus Cyanaurora vandensis]